MILASVVVIPVSVVPILISSKDASVDVTELQYTATLSILGNILLMIPSCNEYH